MRIMVWVKAIVLGSLVLIGSCYLGYNSDWFQKKYLYPFPYQELVYKYALQNEVDPYLIIAVMKVESKFIPTAKSPKGAIGLMQMMPDTAIWVAEQLGVENFALQNLEDPETSICFGAWYLSSLKKEFNDNTILVLAAYNGGRGNVKQWMRQYGWTMTFQEFDKIPFKETREYVGKVLRTKLHYQELYGR